MLKEKVPSYYFDNLYLQNKIKNIIGFQGIIINNIKIKEENCKYPIELEYEKYKAEIIKKIYNGEYILIGNNGKIDKKEI